jgi:outer membrane protein TolC
MAEFYPKLSLSGSVGLDALDLGSLLGADASRFALGLAGSLPVFNGGRLRAQLEVQDAVQEQALIAYEAAVLGAVEEVENAIVALAQEQVRRATLAEAFAAAERAEAVASTRYEAGAEPFLSVLDAQRSRLSAQDTLTASEATVTSNLIRLYKTLGGGWTPPD